jgi:hypothetical protein
MARHAHRRAKGAELLSFERAETHRNVGVKLRKIAFELGFTRVSATHDGVDHVYLGIRGSGCYGEGSFECQLARR